MRSTGSSEKAIRMFTVLLEWNSGFFSASTLMPLQSGRIGWFVAQQRVKVVGVHGHAQMREAQTE